MFLIPNSTNARLLLGGIPWVRVAGGFSLLSLFSGGAEGAWFDPSDISTLFQDSAGTTPVTASGQPVGLMLDISGNGNHATQATSSKRPTYTTGSGLAWLAFDGADDAMATAAIDFTGTDKMSMFAGVRRIDATVGIITELSNNVGSNGNPGSFYLVSGTDAGFTAYSSLSRGTINPGGPGVAGFNDSTNPSTDVVSVTHDIAGDLSTMRTNGVAGTSGTGNKGAGNFGNYTLYIGSRNQITLYFKGNLYGLIIPGKLVSAAEIASTEAYLAAKTGVTL